MASPKLHHRIKSSNFGASLILPFIILLSLCTAHKRNPYLTDFITYYEPVIRIGFPLLHDTNTDSGILFSFRAFGREFHLKLRSGSPILAPGALIVTHGSNGTDTIPAAYILQRLVTGYVKGEKNSFVQGHVIEGSFEGIITLQDEVYYVEPSHFYLSESLTFDSLIYRRSDINVTALICATGDCTPFRLDFKRGPLIPDDEIDEEAPESRREPALSGPESPVGTMTRREMWAKRRRKELRKKICTVKLVADHTFYQKATDHTIETAIHEMMVLVTVADNIFRGTDFDSDGRPDGIGFQVSNVVVWKSKDDANYKMYREDLSSEDFLSAFALHDSSDVCMAVCFVHRIFPGNVLGLAYTASVKRNHAGGVCQKRIASHPPRSYNTAVVTVEGSTGRMPRALNSLTLTHELGHSFGSDHDPKTELCSPSAAKGGSYLMADTIENSNQSNNNRFSPCSIESISRVLTVKSKCFLGDDELGNFVCGNAVREKGEECDCGLKSQCDETDVCCVPKGGDGSQHECHLRGNAQCSPRNGPCCTQDCSLVSASNKMLCSDTDCMENSYCNGVDSECPTPIPKDDGSLCNNGLGICIRGKCTDRTCAQLKMQECLCLGWKFGCHICCISNGLCIPASRLVKKTSTNIRLRQSDGISCNFAQGICQDGVCRTKKELLEGINYYNRSDTDDETTDTGISILATLLGSALVLILFVVVGLLLYFLTPLRRWLCK